MTSFGPARVRAESVPGPAAQTSLEVADFAWVEHLVRRVERLLPVVMASLGAARRERDPLLIRCLDRTVAALHGAGLQLRFHAERWKDESSRAQRGHHERALRSLGARVEDLARMPALCFTGGVSLRSGETRVEVERVKN